MDKNLPKDFIRVCGIFEAINVLTSFIFYKLTYIKDKRNGSDSGYYLTKRIWVWILLSPIAIFCRVMIAAGQSFAEYVASLTRFRAHWISTDEKEDLTLRHKLEYRRRLLK